MKYKRDFKRRRLIILLPLIPAVIAAALGLITDNIAWGYVFAGAALVFAALHVVLWRCPECGMYLGRGISLPGDGRCPMCRKVICEPIEAAGNSGAEVRELAEKDKADNMKI